MKLRIEIRNQKEEKIVEIDVNNGRWKYWDDYFDNDEKIPLTINTVYESKYLHLPVKIGNAIYDTEVYKEEGKLVMKDAYTICYDSLLSFLNYRIDSIKKDIKSGFYKSFYEEKGGKKIFATLFDDYHYENEKTVISDVKYECVGMIKVNIKKM